MTSSWSRGRFGHPARGTWKEQRVLLVHDTADAHAATLFENARWALHYARLRFEALDLEATSLWPPLERFSALALCAESLQKLDQRQIAAIRRFVSSGGGLAVLYRGWSAELRDVFGVASEAPWPDFAEAELEGLVLQTDHFHGLEGLHLTPADASGHAPYDFLPSNHAQILASSSAGRPLAWLNRFGEGRVLYWNSAMLADRVARGLIVQSIACVHPICVLPIANAATIQIDDFPPPLLDQDSQLLPVEDGEAERADFYDRMWLPDMLRIAKEYRLTYSFFGVFSYHDSLDPPYRFRDWEHVRTADGTFAYKTCTARRAAAVGEYGLHGYSHDPLTLEHWRDQQQMREALAAVAAHWRTIGLGALPTAYVPPNNEYDEAGAMALTEAMPTLQTLCGSYLSGPHDRGGSREFGPEPWNDRLFCMPRATYGYELTPFQRFAMVSQIGSMGAWTHFLHPDDVYDTPRHNFEAAYHRNPECRPWRQVGSTPGLSDQFRSWLGFVRATFPWLKYMGSTDAQKVLAGHLRNDVDVRLSSGRLRVTTSASTHFQVRSNSQNQVNPLGVSGAQLLHTHAGGDFSIQTFRSTKNRVEIELI